VGFKAGDEGGEQETTQNQEKKATDRMHISTPLY
jgi:hypothetical protein